MKRDVYYRGKPGKKYGIWNDVKKEFQFGICEDTPMLAEARLYQKPGCIRSWATMPGSGGSSPGCCPTTTSTRCPTSCPIA